jgi:hypothetical protein
VKITYTAGRFANTAAVSPKFKQAAAKMVALMWKGDQGAGTVTFGAPNEPQFFGFGFAIPKAVLELLEDEMKAPSIA